MLRIGKGERCGKIPVCGSYKVNFSWGGLILQGGRVMEEALPTFDGF